MSTEENGVKKEVTLDNSGQMQEEIGEPSSKGSPLAEETVDHSEHPEPATVKSESKVDELTSIELLKNLETIREIK